MRNLVITMLVVGMASVASAVYTDVTDNTGLYHFDDPIFNYTDPVTFESYDLSADDNSSGRAQANLRIGHPDAGGVGAEAATITTGNMGSSGAVGDEALDMNRGSFCLNAGSYNNSEWPLHNLTTQLTVDFDLYLCIT